MEKTDHAFMGACLAMARRAAAKGDVPIGALVVLDGQVIGQGWNLREVQADPTAHAEIVALRQAARYMGRWRLDGASLFVTLEPCVMCAGALVNARIARVVYGCSDPKAGAVNSLFEIVTDERLNHRLSVVAGVRADECSTLLREFFQSRRAGRLDRARLWRGVRAAEGA